MALARPLSFSGGLLRHRRVLGLLIAGGAMLLITATVIGFSGAYFTSTSKSPGNEFAAASMKLVLANQGQIVNGNGMLPGDVRSGDQTLTNTGHRGTLVLEAQDLDQSQQLSRVLDITIQQTDPAQPDPVYDGPLNRLESLQLGTMQKDENRTYTFTVTWPALEDSPALAGSNVSLVFDWQLESVP